MRFMWLKKKGAIASPAPLNQRLFSSASSVDGHQSIHWLDVELSSIPTFPSETLEFNPVGLFKRQIEVDA
jgi:hypothetical protein